MRLCLGAVGRGRRRRPEHRPVREPVVACARRRRREDVRGGLLRELVLLGEQRRHGGHRIGEHVGVVARDVDRRLCAAAAGSVRLDPVPAPPPARGPRRRVRAADGVPGAAQDRARGCPREQEGAGDEQRHADDREPVSPRAATGCRRAASPPRRRGRSRLTTSGPRPRPRGPCGTGARRRVRCGTASGRQRRAARPCHVRGVADRRVEPVHDLPADDTAVPAEVQARRQEEPERDHRQAGELGVAA